MEELLRIKLFDKQEEIFRSNKRFNLFVGGIQCGKTTLGGLAMRLAIDTFKNEDDTFIIAAPDYKTLNQATLPKFKLFARDIGEYKAGPAEFKIRGGGTVYCRTSTHPESMEGITNCRFIWGDEAGRFSKYFQENLEGRSALLKCPILYTTTPYSMNWMADIVKEYQAGKREDWKITQLRSIDSPYFPKDEYERQKRLLDPRRFRMKFMGQFGRMEGLVFDNMVWIPSFPLPEDTVYYCGCDWGYFPDPYALTIRAITPNGIQYRIAERFANFKTIEDIKNEIQARHQIYKFKMVVCDPSQPAHIDYLNRCGIPAVGAPRIRGDDNSSIRYNIDIHYQLIQSGKFFGFEEMNPIGMSEYEMFHYPNEEELTEDQALSAKARKPVDRDNHSIDADMYLSCYLHETNPKKIKPVLPDAMKGPQRDMDEEEMLEFLKSSAIDLNRKD